MANIAILASGSGSNFQAIAEAISKTEHKIACLICDRKKAYAFERAEKLGIKSYYVTYFKRDKLEVENDIDEILRKESCDLVVLAGFMRIFSGDFTDKWINKILNIHPTLLPNYPGAHGIEDSYNSGDKELGVTIHYVDKGMDTGPIIYQESFTRYENESLESVEERIHKLEHKIYPKVLIDKLNGFK